MIVSAAVSVMVGCKSPAGPGAVVDTRPSTRADHAEPFTLRNMSEAAEISKLAACARSHTDELLDELRDVLSTDDTIALAEFASVHGHELLDWLDLHMAAVTASTEYAQELVAWSSTMSAQIDKDPAAMMALLDGGNPPRVMNEAAQMSAAISLAVQPLSGSPAETLDMQMRLARVPETLESPVLTLTDVLSACESNLEPNQIAALLSKPDVLRDTLRFLEQTK